MSKLLFHIKDIECSYQNSPRSVLEISELEIEKNSLVFFVGPSGVGKSTILETLGLMNNTIQSRPDSILDMFDEYGGKISFLNIWKSSKWWKFWKSSDKFLSNIRNEFFSFIFQSNNLFSSLSAFQNVLSSSLVQGADLKLKSKEAQEVINDLLSDLNITSRDEIDIAKMSGGQRQRLSFARAIIADFKVLFADEPTGNLDWYNSVKLLEYLKKKIPDNGAGIIVSHDIELSLKFADKIVIIDKKSETISGTNFSYGRIDSSTVFIRDESNWTNGKIILNANDFKNLIREKFVNDEY